MDFLEIFSFLLNYFHLLAKVFKLFRLVSIRGIGKSVCVDIDILLLYIYSNSKLPIHRGEVTAYEGTQDRMAFISSQ